MIMMMAMMMMMMMVILSLNDEVLDIQNSKCPLNHHHHHHAHLVGIDKRGVVDDGQAGREGGHVQVGTVDYGLLVMPDHS